MSDDKHITPGPWSVVSSPYPDGTPYFHLRAGDAYSEDKATMGFSLSGIMRGPDAHLISAAPDLLAACEMAKDFLVRDLEEPGRTVFWALVDAIRKAKARDDSEPGAGRLKEWPT